MTSTARNVLLGVAVLLALGAAALALLNLFRPGAGKVKLHVYCGTSMRGAAEEIAQEYERRTGDHVEFNFGGSETLLPMVEASGRGDLFITHDPFPEELARKGLVARYETGGYLEPLIVVAKGNPLGLKGLADLAKPGLRVGLMDARYSTCGQMVQDALKRRGLTDKVGPNVRVEKRSHQELATDVTLGSLDAAAVWNFSAVLNREKLDAVPTGETFPETRLCICLLRSAANPKGAGRFTELCASEFGREVFSRHGYSKGMGAKPQQ